MRALVAAALFLKGAVALRQSEDQPMDMDEEDGPGGDMDSMADMADGDMADGPGGDMDSMEVPEIGSMPISELETKLEKLEKMMETMENKVFPDCKDKPTVETCAMALGKCIWKPIEKEKKPKKGKESKKGAKGKDGKKAKGKKSALVEDEDDEDIHKPGDLLDEARGGSGDPTLDQFDGECVDAPKKEKKGKDGKGKDDKKKKGTAGKK